MCSVPGQIKFSNYRILGPDIRQIYPTKISVWPDADWISRKLDFWYISWIFCRQIANLSDRVKMQFLLLKNKIKNLRNAPVVDVNSENKRLEDIKLSITLHVCTDGPIYYVQRQYTYWTHYNGHPVSDVRIKRIIFLLVAVLPKNHWPMKMVDLYIHNINYNFVDVFFLLNTR